jgi:hypothetical protein
MPYLYHSYQLPWCRGSVIQAAGVHGTSLAAAIGVSSRETRVRAGAQLSSTTLQKPCARRSCLSVAIFGFGEFLRFHGQKITRTRLSPRALLAHAMLLCLGRSRPHVKIRQSASAMRAQPSAHETGLPVGPKHIIRARRLALTIRRRSRRTAAAMQCAFEPCARRGLPGVGRDVTRQRRTRWRTRYRAGEQYQV